MEDQTRIAAPVTKVTTAWGAVGVTSAAEAANHSTVQIQSKAHAILEFFGVHTFAEMASYMAMIYTMLLITEWLFKKVVRPIMEKIKKERGL